MYSENSRPFDSMPMSAMIFGSAPNSLANTAFIRRTPCPTSWPKPSPRAIWCTSSRAVARLPKLKSIPPVCAGLIRPSSKHSMAKAVAVPTEMVSRP